MPFAGYNVHVNGLHMTSSCACTPGTRKSHCHTGLHTMCSPWQHISSHPADQHIGVLLRLEHESIFLMSTVQCVLVCMTFLSHSSCSGFIVDGLNYTSLKAYSAWSWESRGRAEREQPDKRRFLNTSMKSAVSPTE